MVASLKSELRKIVTTRMWLGMTLGLVVLAALLAMLFASLVGSTEGGSDPTANPFVVMSAGTAQLVYTAGLQFNITTLLPLAMGVLLITNEYRHKTISSTFLATPNRWVVLVTKMLALLPLGLLLGLVHTLAGVGAGAGLLKVRGYETYLFDGELIKTYGLTVIAMTIWLLLGFGFGMLVHNQVAAVMTSVGAAFILHIALNIFFSARNWTTAAQFLPGNLTSGMLVTSDPTAGQNAASGAQIYLPWWQSSLILLGYALGLAILGAWLTKRRDIA